MNPTSCWLIDSGCSNNMTHNKSLFKEWCEITSSKVRVGDGKHIAVKGKCTIAIPTSHGTKLITDVLYVPDIDQNLLSVGQLVEKGYKVLFNNGYCQIKNENGNDLFRIEMKEKSFILNPLEEEQIAFSVPCVENESCCEIQAINGKEYTSKTFNQFCEESGTHHQLTAPSTPHQSNDISVEHKDDNVAGKIMNEESKVLRVCLDEASQVDKKISIAATQKQKLPIILPMLNAESFHTANKSLVKKIHAALEFDENKYTAFKDISGHYRQGSIDTIVYLAYVQQFGLLLHRVLELARLFPDAQKQKELLVTYNASVQSNRDFV